MYWFARNQKRPKRLIIKKVPADTAGFKADFSRLRFYLHQSVPEVALTAGSLLNNILSHQKDRLHNIHRLGEKGNYKRKCECDHRGNKDPNKCCPNQGSKK